MLAKVRWFTFIIFTASILMLILPISVKASCESGEEYNPISGRCVPAYSGNSGSSDGIPIYIKRDVDAQDRERHNIERARLQREEDRARADDLERRTTRVKSTKKTCTGTDETRIICTEIEEEKVTVRGKDEERSEGFGGRHSGFVLRSLPPIHGWADDQNLAVVARPLWG